MKKLRNLRLLWALYPLVGLMALSLTIGPAWAQDDPVPFGCTGEAYTVRDAPAELFLIDQSVMPFVFVPVPDGCSCLWGPFGPGGELIEIQVNNLGYNIVDNLLYAVAMPVEVIPLNYGIIKIDSNGTVIPVDSNLPNDVRFLAGDVSTDGSTFYINTYPSSTLYTVELNKPEPLVVTPLPLGDPQVEVADWAVNPDDGKLYGAVGYGDPAFDSEIYQLDPDPLSPGFGVNWVADCVGLPLAMSGPEQWYGGAWFNANGHLFVYRNNDHIYDIDMTTAAIHVDFQGAAGSSQLNDAAACALGYGTIDKFYTHTSNDWSMRCLSYVIDENTGLPTDICETYRLPDTDLDDDIFADPLDQVGTEFVLYGKVLKKKTVVTPGQYIAVSNIDVSLTHDVWVMEDFGDCTDIGSVNPNKVPGGVQVVLTDADGVVYDIDGDLASGIGGSIELEATYALVHVEDVPAGSTLRVMVKFKPSNKVNIGDNCINHEILYDADPFGIPAGIELNRASAVLTIVEKD